MTLRKRLIPHPILSCWLICVWLALANHVTLNSILMGGILALVLPALTAPYWPHRAHVGRPFLAAQYALIVFWDIIVANIQVAMIILFKRNRDLKSCWVTVPLDLTSSEAITVLAGTITMTPGTVSAMLSADGGAILVHCLHTDDPDGVRDEIKARYESRLKEIFQ